MRFRELPLKGAWLIELEPARDNRGHFARTFCEAEFEAHGLETRFTQQSSSYSKSTGTLRGMHFQRAPHLEAKLVRCVRGAIFDVIIDMRRGSPTFGKWVSMELSEGVETQLYVPRGFAHGFQTLKDDTEVLYAMSTPYVASASAGFPYADPAFNIDWPLPVSVISERDTVLPAFDGRPID